MQHNLSGMFHDNIIMNIVIFYINMITLHVDINKLRINIIILHDDMISLAYMGQKYATYVIWT